MHSHVPARISVVTLGVSDLESARDYYALVFDTVHQADRSGVCYFRLPGTWLALYPRESLARYCGVDGRGGGFAGITLSVNLPRADDVDRLCERLRAAGGRVTVAPGAASWGGRIAWVADADGHLLELVWNPKAGAPA